MAQEHSFGHVPITCHCFNKDCTQLALSPNSNDVDIYTLRSGKWEKEQSLEEHSQRVNSVDWAPNSDRIVTASADRNAHVWARNAAGQFRPTLVLLRIDRAATVARWSPLENKFAVGSGAKLISVCHFEQEHNWWVCKQIRKPFKSTVTALEWHPNNCLLGAGAADFRARIVSAFLKDTDRKPEPTCWGGNVKFGSVVAEFPNGGGGWVRDVSFSADGSRFAWVAHDSSISVAVGGSQSPPAVLRLPLLPLLSLRWLSDSCIVAGGHDCYPILFSFGQDSGIAVSQRLDFPPEHSGGGGKVTAMSMFGAIDKMNMQHGVQKLGTIHQNSINQVSLMSVSKGRASQFATVGMDGRLVVWSVPALERKFANLRI